MLRTVLTVLLSLSVPLPTFALPRHMGPSETTSRPVQRMSRSVPVQEVMTASLAEKALRDGFSLSLRVFKDMVVTPTTIDLRQDERSADREACLDDVRLRSDKVIQLACDGEDRQTCEETKRAQAAIVAAESAMCDGDARTETATDESGSREQELRRFENRREETVRRNRIIGLTVMGLLLGGVYVWYCSTGTYICEDNANGPEND